jgi:hypothetical protein
MFQRWPNTFECGLKPDDPTVEFRAQADRPPKQRDDRSVAVAGLLYDRAYVGVRRQPLKCVSHRRVQRAPPGKPRDQDRLEGIELSLESARFEQSLADLARRPAPQRIERHVLPNEIFGGCPQQGLGGARLELGTDRSDWPRDIAYVGAHPRATDDGVTYRPFARSVGIVK